MDQKTLDAARVLEARIRTIRAIMDEWEKQEIPLQPDRVRGQIDFMEEDIRKGMPVQTGDEATWKAYKRASIEALQREYDKAEDEFKRL